MKPISEDLREIIDSVKRHIEMEAQATGEEFFTETSLPKPDNGQAKPVPALEDLRKKALSCKECDLWRMRKNVVFGAGSPKAALMFVGEAPGMEEDLQGVPFVGRAGKLLTKIIESIGLRRKDVYIANVLKCRPPNNRNPFPGEILTCEGYLIKQIELIKPKVVCALGKFAAQSLLRSTVPISKLRGEFYDFHGTKLMPTFHPAYLLRNPGEKRKVWEDMKKIRRKISKNAG